MFGRAPLKAAQGAETKKLTLAQTTNMNHIWCPKGAKGSAKVEIRGEGPNVPLLTISAFCSFVHLSGMT